MNGARVTRRARHHRSNTVFSVIKERRNPVTDFSALHNGYRTAIYIRLIERFEFVVYVVDFHPGIFGSSLSSLLDLCFVPHLGS